MGERGRGGIVREGGGVEGEENGGGGVRNERPWRVWREDVVWRSRWR